MSLRRDYANIGILALCEAIFMTTSLVNYSIAGIVAAQLLSDATYATLPLAMIPVVSMVLALPASFVMKSIGRRRGFVIGATAGIASAGLCALALQIASFPLFVVGIAMTGIYQAFATYYRFAVADHADDRLRGQAVALVLAGGLLAAFIGPTMANATREMFTPVIFVGSYVATMMINMLAVLLLMFLRLPQKGQIAPRPQNRRSPIDLSPIFADPRVVLAMLFCGGANAIMMLVMTATPLAMAGCGFDLSASGLVISWHVAAMFAPFLISGSITRYFGTERTMILGLLLMGCSGLVAMSGISFAHFALALSLSGLAWNLMYVGGSTLLASVNDEENRALIQGANEFFGFAMTALGTFSTGLLFASHGWGHIAALSTAVCVGLYLLFALLRTERKRLI